MFVTPFSRCIYRLYYFILQRCVHRIYCHSYYFVWQYITVAVIVVSPRFCLKRITTCSDKPNGNTRYNDKNAAIKAFIFTSKSSNILTYALRSIDGPVWYQVAVWQGENQTLASYVVMQSALNFLSWILSQSDFIFICIYSTLFFVNRLLPYRQSSLV